ncbi:hypothetical protein VNO78_23943 [Psophocarpus tetragonolobus]|uniref:Uncharacterized protein n=1 Tax=Psophocarpus tetragonolobus TaxID=3891 RepID=A0AAN9S5P7_PSOTE
MVNKVKGKLSRMEGVRVMSTTTIKAPSENKDKSAEKMDLTPWDLSYLKLKHNSKGLLYSKNDEFQIGHLQHSLSSTLAFFPPLAGSLAIVRHDDNTVSCHIVCDNKGALFVHAVANTTTVADILQPKYVPPIVDSFFALNGCCYQGTSQPLLAVQVTDLLDGIFIGFSINHMVVDGKSFWHFVNSFAQLSRASPHISKLPSLQRCFLDAIQPPIRFPFTRDQDQPLPNTTTSMHVRLFHFTKETMVQLKSKANAEAHTHQISSLQALLTHLWRSAVRCKGVDPEEGVFFVVVVDLRSRMVPALSEDYFGNAVMKSVVRVKAGELLEAEGKCALEMNKMISLVSHEKAKNHYESWVRSPVLPGPHSAAAAHGKLVFVVSGSPRFNIYDNDFGWGKPVAVRSGGATHLQGRVAVFAGIQEGSVDIEVSLPYHVLEAMGNDPHFLHV